MTAIPSKSILDGSATPTTSQFKNAMGQLHDFLSERTDVAATASGLTVSTNNRVLGRSTAGAGAIEELTIGTAANNIVRLDGSARLPAVDASQLINLPQQSSRQIQPVSASVAANALTVGLFQTILDFRSSTLSNGTINTRTVGTALSLVVPSGATLGTTSGQLHRLVLLAVDNAGVVELAITNLSGGLNLDETSTISTTAISASSNSANVVYSASARTSVPFRVVGYVESTQTTAGIWAASPSAVQGAGGNALTNLQSIGYGQTWQSFSVGSDRVLGVTYYNTTGRPIQVYVEGNGNSQSTSITVNGVRAGGGNTTSTSPTMYVIVPHGASYIVTSTQSTLAYWSELR